MLLSFQNIVITKLIPSNENINAYLHINLLLKHERTQKLQQSWEQQFSSEFWHPFIYPHKKDFYLGILLLFELYSNTLHELPSG